MESEVKLETVDKRGKKVLLIMPTFWDVIAPPVGVISLKSFLQQYGHEVKAVNLNENAALFNTQKKYFALMSKYVPYRGLIPRLGTELLGFHMNAAIFREDAPSLYNEYVEILVREHFAPFLENISQSEMDTLINQLNEVLEEHFCHLKELAPQLIGEKPEYVGCTILSSTIGTALFLLREIKKLNPSIKTVLGGPGPYNGFDANSPNMQRLIQKCPFIDKIVFGEGELIFKAYLEGNYANQANSSCVDKCADKLIENIQTSEKVNISAKDFGIDKIDMNTLPPLDFSDLDLKKYFHLGIAASRGCPFLCSFCSETKLWASFRKKAAEITADEVKYQLAKYGNNKFFFTDALYNHSLTPFVQAILERGLDIEFDCYLRIDVHGTKREMTDLWAKGGLHRVRIGMESASPKILKVMQKGITVEQQSAAIKMLASSGIRTSTYWIAGHPQENEEDFAQTLDFIRKHKNYLYEVDLAVFYFYGEGEIGKDVFAKTAGGLVERWPEKYLPISIFKYFKLKDPNPTRAEAYARAIKFAQTMNEEGIPCNRTSVIDYLRAEKRWKQLVEVHQKNGSTP